MIVLKKNHANAAVRIMSKYFKYFKYCTLLLVALLLMLIITIIVYTKDESITYSYENYHSLNESCKELITELMPEEAHKIIINYNIDTNHIYGKANLMFQDERERTKYAKTIQKYLFKKESNGSTYKCKNFYIYIDQNFTSINWSN